jgi:hypothetical protein
VTGQLTPKPWAKTRVFAWGLRVSWLRRVPRHPSEVCSDLSASRIEGCTIRASDDWTRLRGLVSFTPGCNSYICMSSHLRHICSNFCIQKVRTKVHTRVRAQNRILRPPSTLLSQATKALRHCCSRRCIHDITADSPRHTRYNQPPPIISSSLSSLSSLSKTLPLISKSGLSSVVPSQRRPTTNS